MQNSDINQTEQIIESVELQNGVTPADKGDEFCIVSLKFNNTVLRCILDLELYYDFSDIAGEVLSQFDEQYLKDFYKYLSIKYNDDYSTNIEYLQDLNDLEDNITLEFSEVQGVYKIALDGCTLDLDCVEKINDLPDLGILQAYIDIHGVHWGTEGLDNNFEGYVGQYSDDVEFAKSYCADLLDIPQEIEMYIDWVKYSENLMMNCHESNGYYFHR